MDDRFLNQLRRDPRPEFARDLHNRLLAQGDAIADRRYRWTVPALAVSFAAVAVVSLFAFPAVRASAQAMLDLFRVQKFAAVQFDSSRLDKLRDLKQEDGSMMVFDKPETVVDPGPPQSFPDAFQAANAAGFDVKRVTGALPDGLMPDSIHVQGAGEVRVKISEAKLRAVLEALDIRDVTVPMGIDGQVVDVKKPPVVIQTFRGSRNQKAALIQCPSPEVSLPAGLDIQRLAEVGLRVIGLDRDEARRVAQATDWRTTLVVPVPLNASTFRKVSIHGNDGLLVTMAERTVNDHKRESGNMVMWTENGRVFAVVGNLSDADAMLVADAVQ